MIPVKHPVENVKELVRYGFLAQKEVLIGFNNSEVMNLEVIVM